MRRPRLRAVISTLLLALTILLGVVGVQTSPAYADGGGSGGSGSITINVTVPSATPSTTGTPGGGPGGGGGTLPRTGADILGVIAIAGALIVAGVALRAANRRRRTA